MSKEADQIAARLDARDPDKVLKKAVELTIEIVSDYVEPGPRDAEQTVGKIIETIDTEEVESALEDFDRKRAEAVDITKQRTFAEHEAHMNKVNEENVETGQQGTNEPWQEPGTFSNGRRRNDKNVVEKELEKKRAKSEKAEG